MKRFTAILMVILMFALNAVAFADAQDEIVHNGSLPVESTQEVKITIKGLTDGSGSDPDNRLPSEYHVRVLWEVMDGIYSATATDSDGANGFKNFLWDCERLDFSVNRLETSGSSDIREGNWLVRPSVAFEITNASTPDLPIYASASLKTEDKWANFLAGESIAEQNAAIAVQTVPPVLKANLGTGVNSYEQNAGHASHNVFYNDYSLEWDYNELNEYALNSYRNGTVSTDFVNSFVVTISASK